jgi:hypothetical protein
VFDRIVRAQWNVEAPRERKATLAFSAARPTRVTKERQAGAETRRAPRTHSEHILRSSRGADGLVTNPYDT